MHCRAFHGASRYCRVAIGHVISGPQQRGSLGSFHSSITQTSQRISKNVKGVTCNSSSSSSSSGFPNEDGAKRSDTVGDLTRQLEDSPPIQATKTFLKTVLDSYNMALKKHPLTTKAITSLVGFAIGDRIAQSMGGAHTFDMFRFLRMSLYGVLIDGPLGHYFYRFLDTKVYPEDPKGARAVLTKTAIDQLIWAPVMTCVFLAFLTTLEGHPDTSHIMGVIQARLVPIMLANFTVWPVAHLLNFRYVAPEQRILFNNVVAIAWTTYLSYTCGATTGSDGGAGHIVTGTPRDALTLAAGIPCISAATSLQNASPHAMEIVRETSAINDMLVGWGVDGLPPQNNGGAELLLQYFRLKAEVLETVCRMQ